MDRRWLSLVIPFALFVSLLYIFLNTETSSRASIEQTPDIQPSDTQVSEERTAVENTDILLEDIQHWAQEILGISEIEIARTPAERQRGLSNLPSLPKTSGMLFVFDVPGLHGFWMKDTLFPIDIIWISSEGEIVHIEREIQPETYPEVFQPTQPASYVLEVNAGVGSSVQIGDTLITG